jgi:hypothetical protein
MNRIAPLILTTAIAGLTACGADDGAEHPPFGQAQPPAKSATARYADGDRDGKVTRKEAQADPMLSASFDRYDTDDNDELDRAEFARFEAHALESRGATAPDAARPSSRPRSEFPRPQD